MDRFFDGEVSDITSGLRTAEKQLALIIEKLALHNKEREFPEFVQGIEGKWPVDKTIHIDELNRDLYWFQRGWSRLLNISEIINPPIPAEVLFDYIDKGRNKKGEVIQISPHMRGTALDVGGGKNLLAKAKCVVAAKQSGECFIKDFRIEKGAQNAVHIDCLQIGGGTG